MIDVELVNYGSSSYESLQEKLSEISKFKDSSKIVRAGLKEAGRYLKKRGKSRLQNRMLSGRKGVTGTLLKSFVHKVKKRNSGVLTGFKGGKGGANHSFLISEGTVNRKTSRGLSRGRTRPNHFWSDTREQNAPEAMKIVQRAIHDAIEYLSRTGRY